MKLNSNALSEFLLKNHIFDKENPLQIHIEEEDNLTVLLHKEDKDILFKKIELYKLIYEKLCEFILAESLEKDQFLITVWRFHLPFCLDLLRRMELNPERPLICGILGVQGSGKTTLTKVANLIFSCLKKKILSFSIDDIYKTHEDREKLKAQDPRFYMRGPPGTHDIEIADRIFLTAQKGKSFILFYTKIAVILIYTFFYLY